MRVDVIYKMSAGGHDETFTGCYGAEVLPDGSLKIRRHDGETFVGAGLWFACNTTRERGNDER